VKDTERMYGMKYIIILFVNEVTYLTTVNLP